MTSLNLGLQQQGVTMGTVDMRDSCRAVDGVRRQGLFSVFVKVQVQNG